MSNLEKMKAEAYDIISKIEYLKTGVQQLSGQLNELNKKIAEATQKENPPKLSEVPSAPAPA